jgi:hypothetical protein
LRRAVWVFPLYLLAINLFVLPIALAGLLLFEPGTMNADNFVLSLPLSAGHNGTGVVCLYWWTVCCHRHGDCGNDCGLHHGLQRTGDAAAVAYAVFSARSRA